MKKIILSCLMFAMCLQASNPVSPLSPLKKFAVYLGISTPSWQQDILEYVRRDGKNKESGIEYLQPFENAMIIQGSFLVDPLTYKVNTDRAKTVWKFKVEIFKLDNDTYDVVILFPDVVYFRTVNRTLEFKEYVPEWRIHYDKTEFEKLVLDIYAWLLILNPHAAIYGE